MLIDENQLLLRYLNAVRKHSGIIEKGEAFSLTDGQKRQYIIAPFSQKQISLMSTQNDLHAQLSGIGSFEIRDGVKFLSLSEDFPGSVGEDTIPEKMTNSDLIKLCCYVEARRIYLEEERIPTPEECVFNVKNEAGIPDDFMPPAFMEMVEGRPIVDFDGFAMEMQPSFSGGSIFPLVKISGDEILSVGRLIPLVTAYKNVEHYETKELIQIIKAEFASFTRDEAYSSFLLGRSFRAMMHLLTRGTRELKRPLFDERKIDALLSAGFSEERDGKFFIKEKYDLAAIKNISSEYEEKNRKIAKNWLEKFTLTYRERKL